MLNLKTLTCVLTCTGGMVEYRQSLAASFLFKAFVFVATSLEAEQAAAFKSPFEAREASAAAAYHRPVPSGLQYFSSIPSQEVVGKSHRHMAADLQV